MYYNNNTQKYKFLKKSLQFASIIKLLLGFYQIVKI